MGILCGEKVHIAMNTTTSVISLKKKKNKQKVARIRYRMQKSRKSFQTIPVKIKIMERTLYFYTIIRYFTRTSYLESY